MEFDVLGPLVVRSGDQVIEVPGRKQRALLVALLLHVGEVVSVDRLIDAIWGDDPPANPKNALQSQVSQLRRHLRDERQQLVVSRSPGYVLRADPAAVDAVRFEALVRDGRAALRDGDERRAVQELVTALGFWRGGPLEEFAGQEFVDVAIARLDELRLGAIEDRIECDLRAGHHRELVVELEALVADHPLRERLRGQLMLALARSGRQADALEVFHKTRRVLDDELGIDPSRELMSVYEVLLRQEDEPPAPTATAPLPPAQSAVLPNVLPRPLSSFVGREDDLQRVLELLGGSRLLTLTGPGGVGKTRLAVEAASRTVDGGPAVDGVWLVELAGLHDAELLADTVAETIGLADDSAGVVGVAAPRAATVRIAAALQHRRALLVLDNCEHLVDAVAGFVRDLLGAAHRLTVLCTSREALGITGETVWSVPSLAVPPRGEDIDLGALSRWGATTLFVDRVRDADPDLVIDAPAAIHVGEICRRLDGIPLALELAAARVRTLGLGELADRIDDRFAILTGGTRTALPRQQTLQAVIGWSWDLLDVPERTVFRRLSVFMAPPKLEAIEEVCSDPAVPQEQIFAVVALLVDKSMLVADRRGHQARYRMLESLHAYAADRLADSGEADTFRDRHADYMLAMVADTVPQLRTADQVQAMDRLDDSLDDLRAALRWLEAADDGPRGGRLATELGWYWYLRGHRNEGLRWLATFAETATPRHAAMATLWSALLAPTAETTKRLLDRMHDAARVLDECGTVEDRTFAALLVTAVLIGLGDQPRALEKLESARMLIDRAGQDDHAADADLLTGNALLMVGEVDRARPWLEEGLGRYAARGDRWGQVQCLASLLSCAEMTGDLPAALRHADRGIDLAAQLRLRELDAILHSRRATVAMLAGDQVGAEASLRSARRLADELGSGMVTGSVDLAAGFVAMRSGRLDEAAQLYEGVLAWLGDAPLPSMRAYALAKLGTIAELTGEIDRAVGLHCDSYDQAARAGDPRGVALALEGLAATYTAAGRSEAAAVLIGAAQARRESVGLPLADVERADVDRAEAAARVALGSHAFEAAVQRGRTLADDQLPVSRRTAGPHPSAWPADADE